MRRLLTAEVRIKLFANSLPNCRLCLPGNEKALANIHVFKGFCGYGVGFEPTTFRYEDQGRCDMRCLR